MKQSINNDNYICIQGFMVNELDLKGNELLIYAIIYGFTQLENQDFKGSLQYLADWCNSTKQGVIKALKSLIDKGLIEKQETIFNNVKFVSYYATKFNSIKQSLTGYSTKFNGGIKQSLPNNINNNINNNIKESISKDIKESYGEYKRIKLTKKEYEKLIEEFGQDKILRAIEKVDEYVESNNNKNKYTNFYLVIRNAIRGNWFKINDELVNENIDELVKIARSYPKEERKNILLWKCDEETAKKVMKILDEEIVFEEL